MKDPAPAPQSGKPVSAAFAAFDQLTRRLMAATKVEIDAREAEYQKQQTGKPKRGPKPGPKND